ncbi:MAG: hypothetical protein P4L82_11900 [Ancalomicrobiaceae bacterium]|nr:hypothetical protein [Ancalomicrobiaceae bacterium]
MSDFGAAGLMCHAIRMRGVAVQLVRLSGYAPNVVSFTADVSALVEQATDAAADVTRAGISASEPGNVSQTSRKVTVLADDLKAKRFPLPIVKGDKLIIKATGDEYTVGDADAYRRAFLGVVDLTVAGLK